MNYDFSILSPAEFEQLSRDILQKKMKIDIESFTTGRDGSIDLRYAKGINNVIIQCKRNLKYSDLRNSLKEEIKKIEKINPTKYILTN